MGLAMQIMRLSTGTARATSPCLAGHGITVVGAVRDQARDDAFRLAQQGGHLRLSKGEVEHEPQAEHRLDCRVRVAPLSARRAAAWCLPSSQRCFVHPYGDVTSPEPSRLVSRPVRDPVAGLGNAMTARGVVLERHGRDIPAPAGSGYPGIRAPTPIKSRKRLIARDRQPPRLPNRGAQRALAGLSSGLA